MEKEERTMEKDLISELPDPLLHHILSYVDMVYAVRTCVLSRRWRYVWTSMQKLSFDQKDYFTLNLPKRYDYDTNNNYNFIEFIDDVISIRNRSNTIIHTLRIRKYEDVLTVVNDGLVKWINVVVQRNVVVLDIHIRPGIVLPRSLLNCKSLETLSVQIGYGYGKLTLEVPDSVDLPALKTLRLKRLTFVGEEFNTIVSRCTVLETLVISGCYVTKTDSLIVDAPQLKHLKIVNMWMACKDAKGDEKMLDKNVTINAPNITSFKCMEGYEMVRSSLVEAVDPKAEKAGAAELYVQRCLTAVSKVKTLFLYVPNWLFQACFGPPGEECHIQISFYSLTFLKLRTSVVQQQTNARYNLLETCPNLETLVLSITEGPHKCNGVLLNEIKLNSIDEESLRSKPPLECISYHLKFVEIWGDPQALENEFAFVKFLLQNASVLERLSFRHGHTCSRSRVLNFLKDVESITRAPPNVKISLLDDNSPKPKF